MSYLCFLQNAWSPVYAGKRWPRNAWLGALRRSRSGKRLQLMLDDLTVCYNITPEVGNTSGSKIAPDYNYVENILSKQDWSFVVTCGKSAENCIVNIWDGPVLAVPHPAYRLLTNALYEYAGKLIKEGRK